jgi:hypothetical protein
VVLRSKATEDGFNVGLLACLLACLGFWAAFAYGLVYLFS